MNVVPPTNTTGSHAGAAAARWLGRSLAWERRLAALRAEAAGTPRLTPRVRPATPDRRVA